jgi:transcriptional regulator with XRE-family HTH domain
MDFAMQLNTPTPPNSPNSSVSNGPPADAGKLIRAWRHRAGLTQEGLAHSLSVTFSTVSRWENGHVLPSRLAWRALQQLAAERGCPLVDDNGATVPANAAANGAHA